MIGLWAERNRQNSRLTQHSQQPLAPAQKEKENR